VLGVDPAALLIGLLAAALRRVGPELRLPRCAAPPRIGQVA
jgi:hypothetical protein